ncbi:Dipeptide and tripeptide permease A [Cedecea neteri]|uniref:Dipeptide and tripeptide permease A n=1 Tax=Cedecea neteri TaxID=158822 RepID=A0A2X3KZT8_9ENTR|nr:Dipeptide and tripeptide permease A [Cedecea neteri]
MSTANKEPAESVSLNAFKQPKSFYLIFSIELWERFGYYGLQGIMAVYLVKMLGMSEADSITLFSSFSALFTAWSRLAAGWAIKFSAPNALSCLVPSYWLSVTPLWPTPATT